MRTRRLVRYLGPTHAFEPRSFDLLTSRFGVMFFGDPVAAFANLRGALAPEGRVAMAAFRSPAENPWASAPLAAVRHLVTPPPPPGPEAPGQFAFADPARVRRILAGAGFTAVTLAPADPVMRLGDHAESAAEAAMTLGPARRALDAVDAPAAVRGAVRDSLRDFFHDHEGPDGVAFKGAIWLITARR